MIENNPQLIPGSVWLRERKGKQSFTTVIAVSNVGLKPEVLEEFPQQVVFLTDKFTVLTQGVETFCASRVFYSMDERVQYLAQEMLTPPSVEGEEEDLIDFDNMPQEQPPSGDNTVEPAEVVEADNDVPPLFQPATWDLNGVLLNLDDAFVSYEEIPTATHQVQHVITFALGNGVELDTLLAAFAKDQITEFTVDCNNAYPTSVAVEAYQGVYLRVDSQGNGNALVYVTSDHALEETQTVVPQQAVLTIPNPNAGPIMNNLVNTNGASQVLQQVPPATFTPVMIHQQ